MRLSPVRDLLQAAGASFQELNGVETAARFKDRDAEYRAIRDGVGLTDFSWVRAFSVPEEKGIDFLDALVAGNVPKIRFGRVLHTFLADDAGFLVGDCYVANNDQEFIFLCESLLPDSQFDQILRTAGAAAAGVTDLSPTHAVFSLDGFRAWEVVKKVFGPDVLGLPYLSIENYSFENVPIRLLRAGKTSEFGYLLLAPATIAPALFQACRAEAENCGGSLCGMDIHHDLRLEGRFFNIHAEGARVRDPLILGLQWMIDLEKEHFIGRTPILQRRADGLTRKLIGLAAEPGAEGLMEGAPIFHRGKPVAEVVASCFSGILNHRLALAVFPNELAYSGLTWRLGSPDGPTVRSISMPPIMPKSFAVKLDEM